MRELLAPAGNFEALVAAISNGADAIYLGMDKFGARAYASNFNEETFKQAIEYAHLREVKIYVTMNTIIFEDEIEPMKEMVDFLVSSNVDGIIIQDLVILDYIVNKYPDLEAHCSTQMGLDDLEGTLLFKELGAKRVVLSRELEIEKIKEIKKIAKIPLEIFVHGALCVSYSGNCLMSGLIGYRSGNRGRCVGSCRKPFELIDITNNKSYGSSYILSMKDLCTIDYINEYKDIDSLKIEGRMKEPAYVANVVSTYRKALDNQITKNDKINLNKTFNRTFTKGYIFHEDKKDITNIDKPNNYGFLIGKIIAKNKLGYKIKLDKVLNQNDIIRIDHNGEDVNLTVVKMCDDNNKLINSSSTTCYINIKEDLSIGDLVYKTKDYLFYNEIEKTYPKEFKRFKLDIEVYAYTNNPLVINCSYKNYYVTFESEDILTEAINLPTDEAMFVKQFDRLNDTVYKLGNINYNADNCFIPAKLINEARRKIVELMNKKRLERKYIVNDNLSNPKINFNKENVKLAVFANTVEQYEAAKECGIDIIYNEDNYIRRNQTTYPNNNNEYLIGGYGGVYAFKNKNFVTDFSLNVVNSKAVYMLHKLGAKRVTLSYEMNKSQIEALISEYQKQNDGLPNLEMIVYGKAHLLFTKYCPLKKYGLCGKCKENKYIIKDEYGEFPIISHKDCTTTIINGKTLNLIDELETINNINVFRLQFTTESKQECIDVINMFKNKLNTLEKTNLFNNETDTRGHFKKEIL